MNQKLIPKRLHNAAFIFNWRVQYDLQREGLVWCVCCLRPRLVRGDYYSDWGSEMSKETGGQAFPQQKWEYDGQNNVLQYQEDGLTIRDYFAAKALQGMITTSGAPALSGFDGFEEIMAKAAYKVADEMLKARNS